MIIRKKNKYFFLLISILVITLINISFIIKNPYFAANLSQEMRIFTCQPSYRNHGLNNLTKIRYVYEGFVNFLKNGCNVENLKIDISFKNFEKIKKDRLEAMKLGFNFDAKEVPVKIYWKGNEYRAQARIKGDFDLHWARNKQWSLRIEIKDNKSIEGFKEFSITKFAERQFPENILLSNNLSKLGLATPKYIPMKINVNGVNWGLMLAEEQYSNAYLELRNLKEAPILKLSNGENTHIYYSLKNKKKKISELNLDNESIKLLYNWRGIYEIDIYNKKKYVYNPQYINLISTIKSINESVANNNISPRELEKFININQFAKAYASAFVWGDLHSLGNQNIRFYLNPYTSKMETIPTDHVYDYRPLGNLSEIENLIKKLDPFYLKILELNSFQLEYLKSLENIRASFLTNYNDLKKICKKYGDICFNYIDFEKIKKNLDLLLEVKLKPFEIINETLYEEKNFIKQYIIFSANTKVKSNIKNKNKKLQDLNLIYKELDFVKSDVFARVFADGEIKLYNLTPFETKINKIILNNKKLNISKFIRPNITLDGSSLKKITDKKFQILENIDSFNSIDIYTTIDGIEKKQRIPIEDIRFKKINLSKSKKEFPKFIKLINKDYIIESGRWIVNEPLIIPTGYNLRILPNTEILFKKNTYLYIVNGKLESNGSSEEPISLKPYDKYWGGIYVSESTKDSIINETIISGTEFFKHNSINLTGGINFYKSNVKITNSSFDTSFAEDTINIVSSNFFINKLSINNSKSDGVDSDFSNGEILNSKFLNIGGDGVDTSGSNVSIKNSNFDNIKDKAISVGEKSKVYLNKIKINNSGFGFVSKDSSVVNGSQLTINNSSIAAIAAYNKKSFYAGGSINLTSTSFKDKIILIQSGSEAIINNQKIKTQNFTTSKLY